MSLTDLLQRFNQAFFAQDEPVRETEPDSGFTMAAGGPETRPPEQSAETRGPDSGQPGGQPASDKPKVPGSPGREQLLKLLDAAVKIKTDKDRRALLNPAGGLDFVVTGVVRLTAAFLLLFSADRLARFLGDVMNKADQVDFYSAVIDVLGFALVLWTVVSAVGYGRWMARKQLYKRLSARFKELG